MKRRKMKEDEEKENEGGKEGGRRRGRRKGKKKKKKRKKKREEGRRGRRRRLPNKVQQNHGSTLCDHCRNKMAVPMSRMLMSPLMREPFSRIFSTPPSSMHRMAFLMYWWPWILGAREWASWSNTSWTTQQVIQI